MVKDGVEVNDRYGNEFSEVEKLKSQKKTLTRQANEYIFIFFWKKNKKTKV